MTSPTPCLRPEVSAQPVQIEGETLFKLFDTAGFSTAEIVISPAFLFVVMQLDGSTSILDIQDRFARETDGILLPSEKVQEVLDALDKAYFLQGERFDSFVEQLRHDFLASDTRPAVSAGSSYAEDPEALAEQLTVMMESAPPPEEPGEAEGGSRPAPRGMIIPHIDYTRGAAGYGQAYRELAAREAPEVVVILGTGHRPMRNRIAICPKDFAVPGGVVRHARDVTTALLDACRGTADLADDLLAHLAEHSVELQAVWVRHVWGEAVGIVPVLVGSMQPFLCDGEADVEGDSQLSAFVKALTRLLQTETRVMLLASADLAHVGPYFQDENEITEAYLKEVEEADRRYLADVATGEAGAGLACLQTHRDRYNVCGAGCIHVLNTALPGVRGRLLGYHQAATPEMHQAVTYATMLFE